MNKRKKENLSFSLSIYIYIERVTDKQIFLLSFFFLSFVLSFFHLIFCLFFFHSSILFSMFQFLFCSSFYHFFPSKSFSFFTFLFYFLSFSISFFLSFFVRSFRDAMAKLLDCGLDVSEFKHQSYCSIHFWTNTLGKGMKTSYPHQLWLSVSAVLQQIQLWHQITNKGLIYH